jgi:hypothetical protein
MNNFVKSSTSKGVPDLRRYRSGVGAGKAKQCVAVSANKDSLIERSTLVVEAPWEESTSGGSVPIVDLWYQELNILDSHNVIKKDNNNQSNVINHLTVFTHPNKDMLVNLLDKTRRNNLQFVIPIDLYQNDGPVKIFQVLSDCLLTLVLFGLRISPTKAELLLHNAFLVTCDVLYSVDRSLSEWMSVIKFKLGNFAAWAKDSQYVIPNPFKREVSAQIFKDKQVVKFLLILKESNYLDYMSCIDSLARGVKKGAPRPTKEECAATIPGTFAKFTQQRIPCGVNLVNPRTGFDLMIDQNKIFDEIERTVEELIPSQGRKFNEPNLKWKFFPSTSASVESKKGEGGQVNVVQQILKSYPVDNRFSFKLKKVTLCEPILNGYEGIEGDPSCDQPIRDNLTQDERIMRYVETPVRADEQFIEMNMGSEPGDFSTKEIETLAKLQLGVDAKMELIALAEALKVRGISKGQALESWLLKPIQQYVSGLFDRFPVFASSKGPLTVDMIDNMFSHLNLDVKIGSCDYKDATNEIRGIFTRKVITTILHNMNIHITHPNLFELAVRSLTDNFVSYVDSQGDKHIGKQCEGQPMGKMLSFICLNVLNFTVCRLACEVDQGIVISLKKFKGLINGDDCCFQLNNFLVWEQISSVVGLVNSVGKTFHSNKFVEMNSRTFIRNPTGVFTSVPFVNFGILKGLLRSGEIDSIKVQGASIQLEKIMTIGTNHQELIQGLEKYYTPLTDLFMRENREILQSKLLQGISWFMPAWLGGLGMRVNPDLSNFPLMERKIAGLLYANYTELGIKKLSMEPEWVLHKSVNEVLATMEKELTTLGFDDSRHNYTKVILSSGELVDLEQNQSELYSSILNVIWRNGTLNDIFVPENEKVEKSKKRPQVNKTQIDKAKYGKLLRDLNANRKARARAMQSLSLGTDPLEWHKLWPQKQKQFSRIIYRNYSNEQSTKENKEGQISCIQAGGRVVKLD